LLKLTRNDLREWLIDLAGENLSENSKRRMISALRGFYKFLQFDGHIKKNPAEDLIAPQKGVLSAEIFESDGHRKFAARAGRFDGNRFARPRDFRIDVCLRLARFRSGYLKLGDVDVDAGILTCTGKGSKTRKVPVGKSAVEWLKSYLILRRKKENIEISNIFVSGAGKPINARRFFFLSKNTPKKSDLKTFRRTL
jgi:site-specific recombinase XerC